MKDINPTPLAFRQAMICLAVLCGHVAGIACHDAATTEEVMRTAEDVARKWEAIRRGVRGNRPESSQASYADLKLIVTGTLRMCLETLEGTET